MSKTRKTSRAAIIISSLYLAVVAASLLIMWMTVDETAMSGIFLVLLTLPWSFLLTWVQDLLPVDGLIFNALFLVSGGLVNTAILYKVISFAGKK